jgi:hypothetical protein
MKHFLTKVLLIIINLTFKEFPLSFNNSNNIWNLTNLLIPDMFEMGDNFEFERPAQIQINLVQQLSLANLNIPLQIDDVVAFSTDGKVAQIYKITSFNDITFCGKRFKKIIIKDKPVTWALSKVITLKNADRKKIVRVGLLFTKKWKLKKNSIKYLNSYHLE